MPDLDQSDFAEAFAFRRPAAAPVRDGDGNMVSAAPDVPRFDHGADGQPKGYLVAPGTLLGQADRARIDPLMLPADMAGRKATILHAMTLADGSTVRRAYYVTDAEAAINALLSLAGHHASIGVLDGFRESRAPAGQSGFVRYRAQSWYLSAAIATGTGRALGDGSDRPLIGS